MDKQILRLYPPPAAEVPLRGLYLQQDLRGQAGERRAPVIYSNFITSLDGRIAIPHPSRPGMVVPEATANPRDWRLFQELAVQADLLITTGRYLRDYADGRAQEILQVYDDPAFADLKAWRLENGLPPQPDLAVVSASLDFPLPPRLDESGRSIVVVTTRQADPDRVGELEGRGWKVLAAGEAQVDGRLMASLFEQLGYRLIYSTAGPKVLHMLVSAGVLDRLYLTVAARLLGGNPFSSINEGPLLAPPADFGLQALYFDPYALDRVGQLLSVYERQHPA